MLSIIMIISIIINTHTYLEEMNKKLHHYNEITLSFKTILYDLCISIICLNIVYNIYFQGVFEINKEDGIVMTEIADGVTVEQVKAATGCELKVSHY